MANLLLNSTKHIHRRVRLARVALVAASMTLAGVVVGGALLVPLVLHSDSLARETTESASPRDGADVSQQRQQLTKMLQSEQVLITRVHAAAVSPAVSVVLSRVFARYGVLDTFTITAVNLDYADGGAQYRISVSGIAPSRAAVVTLHDSLVNDPDFLLKAFPISNFTPRDDVYNVSFSLMTETP